MSVRRHGLERPLDAHQLVSWGVLLVFVSFYYSLYVPMHWDAVGITMAAMYSASALLAAFFGFKTTATDPVDLNARAKRETKRPTDVVATPRAADNYCYLCEASVAQRSKHCRRCNKCVAVFDHHCPWVNNCIGSGNYLYFLSMLGSTFAMTGLQFGCGIQSLVNLGDPAFSLRVESSLLPPAAYGCLVGGCSLAVLLTALLVSQLLFFHLGLIYRGVTTYEFIVSQRQKAARASDRKRTRFERCGDEVQNNAPCLTLCQLCCDEQLQKRQAQQRAAKDSVRPPRVPGGSVRMSGQRSSTRRSASSAASISRPRVASPRMAGPSGTALPLQGGVEGTVQCQGSSQGSQSGRAAAVADEDSFPLRIPSFAAPSETGSDRSSAVRRVRLPPLEGTAEPEQDWAPRAGRPQAAAAEPGA